MGKFNQWTPKIKKQAQEVKKIIEYRETPKRLIVGPVKHFCQMIHDAEGNHVCDIRGYGILSYMENGDALQDKIGDWVADAINEKLTKDPI